MAVTEPIALDSTLKEVVNELRIANQLKALDTPSEMINSWEQLHQINMRGVAHKYLSVGDQLTVTRTVGNTPTEFVLDVLDVIPGEFDNDGLVVKPSEVWLGWHNCIENRTFCPREAMYYAEASMPVGTYNFTLLSGYDTAYGGGKTYQFTTTKEVPLGGQVVFNWDYNKQASTCSLQTYASATATSALETLTVSEGSGGKALGVCDGSANCNHAHRLRYGDSSWKRSYMRDYLNSEATTYAPNPTTMSKWRRANPYGSIQGFLKGFEEGFVEHLKTQTVITANNSVIDGGGVYTTKDKMFLLSRTEVFCTPEYSAYPEGAPLKYYKLFSDLTSAGNGADSNRTKLLNGSPRYWWLRTPYSSHAGNVRIVHPDGSLTGSTAYNSYGAIPACIFS